MAEPLGTGTDGAAARVAYFVIRVRSGHNSDAAGLAGTAERLGSGRAHPFSGAEELLHLLTVGANASRQRRAGSQ